MNTSAAIARLYRRPAHLVKLGLETVGAVLERLGNPHRDLICLHVAGTNGKGSVCAMLDAILRAAGMRVGLYTSPHLVRFHERIRVDGACIAEDDLAAVLEAVERADRENAVAPGGRELTFFEFATCLAFEHFRRRGAQVVVLETGMGGRLDATNVVTPLLTVITRIALEHTQYLGHTLEAIAGEKAGIVKPRRPVICGAMPPEARAVIAAAARERGAPFVAADETINVRRLAQDWNGQKVKIETENAALPALVLPLLGRHQLENCATAVAAAECARDLGLPVTDGHIVAGLKAVSWPGRLQVLERDPPLLLDVAHNPDGAAALAATLKELLGREKIALVAGLLADKDAAGFFRALAGITGFCRLAPIHNERAMPSAGLAACARAAGLAPETADLPAAIAAARDWARAHGSIAVIAGSLYLAGETLAAGFGTLPGPHELTP